MIRPVRALLRLAAVASLAALAGCATLPGPLGAADDTVEAPALRGGAPAGQADRVVVVAVDNPIQSLSSQAGTTPGLYESAPRYVTGSQARRQLEAVGATHGLKRLAAWPIPLLGLHCATFLIPEGADRDTVIAQLKKDPRVALAQPLNEFETRARTPAAAGDPLPAAAANLPVSTAATAPAPTAAAGGYNDPYLPLQHHLRAMGVIEAHRCSRGAGVNLAVIDTGVDTSHVDLQGLQATSANFVDDNPRQFAADLHGTEVVGIISARPGNAQGIVGMAPDARLMLFKACWQKGTGGAAVCNSFTLAQALSAAISRGAQVINLSLGGPADGLLTQLVQRAVARGIVVVGAAPPGEAGSGFPVGVPGVIAVRSTLSAGPALQAPGDEVLTLTPGGRYDFGSGSSLAAAHVSAAAALLLQQQPGLDGPAIEKLLRGRRGSGGPLPLCEALAALERPCTCSPVNAATLSPGTAR